MIVIITHNEEGKNTHLLWNIITMPSNNIEGREILYCIKEFTTKLLHYGVPRIRFIFKPSTRNKENKTRRKTKFVATAVSSQSLTLKANQEDLLGFSASVVKRVPNT